MPTNSTSFRDGASASSHFSMLEFMFRMRQGALRVATLVKILSVTNTGDVSPVGFVDVQPLVQQVDGLGKVTDLPKIYNVPYFRLQGGTNAVIIDPEVGDLGIVVFADRDLTNVVNTKAKAAPGSARHHNLSDALYIGGVLNDAPEQYVQFNADGLTVNSPTKVTAQIGTDANAARIVMDENGIVLSFGGHSITINSSGIAVSGAQTNDSSITAQGEVKAHGTTPLHTHVHSGVSTGSSNSGPPTV